MMLRTVCCSGVANTTQGRGAAIRGQGGVAVRALYDGPEPSVAP